MTSSKDRYPNLERMYPIEPVGAPGAESEVLSEALADLGYGRWSVAERGFTATLMSTRSRPAERSLAVVGAAQARLLGSMDARGAFAMLQSPLNAASELEAHTDARLNVVLALLFATPELGVFEPTQSRVHALSARRALSQREDAELLALGAVAELFASLFDGDVREFRENARARMVELEAANSPVMRCLKLEISALCALAAGDLPAEGRILNQALEAARTLGFAAAEARLLARTARRALEAGCPALALTRLSDAADALTRAGAEASWVNVGIAETRRVALEEAQLGSAFVFAATGVRFLPVIRPSVISPPPLSSDARLESTLDAEIARLAPSRATVLLLGGEARQRLEVARALHERSTRARGPFVTLDVSSLKVQGVEEALFGGIDYVGRGIGAIQQAARGTLHLAEVDALPLIVQPRLLRFLDDDERVRVVVSSNQDLTLRVAAGEFRKDLGERLALVKVVLPNTIVTV